MPITPASSLTSTPENLEHLPRPPGLQTSQILPETDSKTTVLHDKSSCDFAEINQEASSSVLCDKQSNLVNPNAEMFEHFFWQNLLAEFSRGDMGCTSAPNACEIGSVNASKSLPDLQTYFEQECPPFEESNYYHQDFSITSVDQYLLDDILVALTPESLVNNVFDQEIKKVPSERPSSNSNSVSSFVHQANSNEPYIWARHSLRTRGAN